MAKKKTAKKNNGSGRPVSEATKILHASELGIEQVSAILRDKIESLFGLFDEQFDEKLDRIDDMITSANNLAEAIKTKA